MIVPAYKEEKVICRTIESLLSSNYPNFEIIIVDDGSQDDTHSIAREKFAGNHQVKVFQKNNAGKAKALNFGWRQSDISNIKRNLLRRRLISVR